MSATFCRVANEIRDPFLCRSCLVLNHKMCCLLSVHRASFLFWMSSQRCSRKTPGIKSNTDWSKGVGNKPWAGAAQGTARVFEEGHLEMPKQSQFGHFSQHRLLWLLGRQARSPFQRGELTHLCITLHQFSSKTAKYSYGRESPQISPNF